jgi:hypothetical protein
MKQSIRPETTTPEQTRAVVDYWQNQRAGASSYAETPSIHTPANVLLDSVKEARLKIDSVKR